MSRELKAAAGGMVRADNGVQLRVPAHVMKRNGIARITSVGHGVYDLQILAPWSGPVIVTVPLDGHGDEVMHEIGGYWVPESDKAGQGTVWVDHLSPFSALSSLASKAVGAASNFLCIKLTVHLFLECLLEKGLSQINSDLAHWLLGKLSSSCAGALFVDGVGGGPVDVALGAINEPACIGSAGGPGSTYPQSVPPGGTGGSGNQSPPGQPAQPPATVEQLTVTLTENPFRCDGGTRELGYVSGAAPGEQITFSSPQLGRLNTARAGPDGRVPLTWVCQPSDVGTTWQVIAKSANGATVSFAVTGTPGATPSSGQQVYWHHIYHTCANGKCGLRLHTGPGYSSYPVTRVLVDGDAVGIVCQARGEPVSGIDGSSSDVWDRTTNGDWAADFYVDTPGTTGSFSPPIPPC